MFHGFEIICTDLAEPTADQIEPRRGRLQVNFLNFVGFVYDLGDPLQDRIIKFVFLKKGIKRVRS